MNELREHGEAGRDDDGPRTISGGAHRRKARAGRRSKVIADIRRSLCTSVNQRVVHGIPSPKRKLREGDIVSIDFGMEFDGYFADAAVTVPVGEITPELQKLLRCDPRIAGPRDRQDARRATAWAMFRPRGAELGRSRTAIRWCGNLCGTASARKMHDEPNVPNYGEPGRGPRLQEGMVFAIEPMVNAGGPEVQSADDEWTAETADGSPSAHFEHTVAVTANGPWILTRPKEMTGPSW